MAKHLAVKKTKKNEKVAAPKKTKAKTEEKKEYQRPHREQFNLWGIDPDIRDYIVRAATARGISSAEYVGQMSRLVMELQKSDNSVVKKALKNHGLDPVSI